MLALDLATGDVGDVQSPDVDLVPAMRGRARAQALDPAGTALYTLYTIGRDAEPLRDLDGDGYASLDEHADHGEGPAGSGSGSYRPAIVRGGVSAIAPPPGLTARISS